MEIVRILGIDPGLRFTGYGILNYNFENNEIWASDCGVIKNTTEKGVKGLEKINIMKNRIMETLDKPPFEDCDNYIIEVPAAIFNKNFSAGSLIPVAVVSGFLLGLFHNQNVTPVYPVVWNQRRKKEVTRANTEEVLGDCDTWKYLEKIPAKGQMEHVVDAVSIALWFFEKNYMD